MFSKPSFNAFLAKGMLTISSETHHSLTNIYVFHTNTTLITNMRYISCNISCKKSNARMVLLDTLVIDFFVVVSSENILQTITSFRKLLTKLFMNLYKFVFSHQNHNMSPFNKHQLMILLNDSQLLCFVCFKVLLLQSFQTLGILFSLC